MKKIFFSVIYISIFFINGCSSLADKAYCVSQYEPDPNHEYTVIVYGGVPRSCLAIGGSNDLKGAKKQALKLCKEKGGENCSVLTEDGTASGLRAYNSFGKLSSELRPSE